MSFHGLPLKTPQSSDYRPLNEHLDWHRKEVFRGPEYIAYQDATEAVYTFSLAAQGPAHPAAICRKPVRDGDSMILQMVIVCKGESESCQRLESDFKLLNAQMEAAIRNEAAGAAEKK